MGIIYQTLRTKTTVNETMDDLENISLATCSNQNDEPLSHASKPCSALDWCNMYFCIAPEFSRGNVISIDLNFGQWCWWNLNFRFAYSLRKNEWTALGEGNDYILLKTILRVRINWKTLLRLDLRFSYSNNNFKIWLNRPLTLWNIHTFLTNIK